MQPVLAELDPPKATGRKRAEPRRILRGIVFRLRTGCQWNQLPKAFGDDSTIRRTFQRWGVLGVLSRIWRMLVQECEERGGVALGVAGRRQRHGQGTLGGSCRPQPPRPGQGGE